MLEAKKLVEALSKEQKDVPTTFSNSDDYDFGEVLKFCSDNKLPKHKIRYSDGVERINNFD